MSTANDWLRRETPKHTDLLTKLRERLEKSLDSRIEYDADGQRMVIPADTTPAGTPDREWCRAFQRYSTGYTTILAEERERVKLTMMAKTAGMATLSDEDYEREMLALGREAVKELSASDLEAELKRRGIALPLPHVED